MQPESLTRERLLEMVREVAARNSGNAPGVRKFTKDTGIPVGRWQGRLFRDWNSVVAAAGLQANELSLAYSDEALFEHLATLTRELGHFPKVSDLRVAQHAHVGFPSEKVFRRRGGMTALLSRLADWALTRPEWADVRQILIAAPATSARRRSPSILTKTVGSAVRVSDSYLPPILECLAALGRAESAVTDELRREGRDPDLEFERRVGAAWTLLGLRVDQLGQGRGRVADGIARSPGRDWALVYDAKVRQSGFRIGTEDRKFREYVETHERELRREGFRSIYFVVVSSHFNDSDMDKARELVRVTGAKSCVLVEADALVWLVEDHLRTPHDRDLTWLERKLAQTRILSRDSKD